MLLGDHDMARRVARSMNAAFPQTICIVEAKRPRWEMLRRRIRRVGLVRAAGQVGFRALHARLAKSQTARIGEIWQAGGLEERPLRDEQIMRVRSINDEATHRLLAELSRDVVIAFGVSKLSARTIAACGGAPILNLHPGITPDFRGVHTGYWALRAGRADAYGATIHLIDEGLDTGPIVAQVRSEPGANIAHHNAKLTVAALPALIAAVRAATEGRLEARPAGEAAALYREPTLWDYLASGIRHGIW